MRRRGLCYFADNKSLPDENLRQELYTASIFAGLCLVCTFFLWNKKNPIADTVEEDDDDFSDIDSDGSRGL